MAEPTAELVQTAIEVAPEVIGFFRSLFASKKPDAPEPTSEDVMAALESAFASSRAKDEAWLATHPETPAEPATPVEPPAAT